MKIVTGHTGENHITSDDDRGLYAGIFGNKSYVLNTGTKLAFNIESSNTIRLEAGDIVHQGTHARIPHGEYTDVTIDNGTSGFKRADLIVARYKKEAGLESMELVVIKGTPTTGNPVDPDHITGNILEGADESDMLLYRVTLDGVNIANVAPLYSIYTGFDNVYRKENVYTKDEVYTKGEVDDIRLELEGRMDGGINALTGAVLEMQSKLNGDSSQYVDYRSSFLSLATQIGAASDAQALSVACGTLASTLANLLDSIAIDLTPLDF